MLTLWLALPHTDFRAYAMRARRKPADDRIRCSGACGDEQTMRKGADIYIRIMAANAVNGHEPHSLFEHVRDRYHSDSINSLKSLTSSRGNAHFRADVILFPVPLVVRPVPSRSAR